MLPQALKNQPNKRERHAPNSTNLVRSLQLITGAIQLFINNPLYTALILIACLGTACIPWETSHPSAAWEYTELRLLSDPDQDNLPGDFIAGYAREAGGDLQLRLDLLEMDFVPENDFYIALDYQPGGSTELPVSASAQIAWDSLLFLPASGIPQVLFPQRESGSWLETLEQEQVSQEADFTPRYVRIPWQDYLLVSINKAFIPGYTHNIKIEAFSTLPLSTQVRDSIGPFNTRGLPPERAAALLAFWNTFPAYSPAQALRKWDGAHTGPYGERHGLAILLNNLGRYEVPAVLLDLRHPAALSALDHLEVIPQIRSLLDKKLLTLPDVLPGSPAFPLFPSGLPAEAAQRYLEFSNQVSAHFEIPQSDMLYHPFEVSEPEPGYAIYFTPSSKPSRASSHIPVPAELPIEEQAGSGGLSLEIRRKLIQNALDRSAKSSNFPVLVLGGSLPESAFGDPSASAAALSYIANHPWIQPLNSDNLLTLPSSTQFQFPDGNTQVRDTDAFQPATVLHALPDRMASRNNQLFEEAWLSAFSLYATLPPEPDTLAELRSAYSGYPGVLLAAASWADAPYAAQNCQVDLDWDGIPECILSTKNQFAVVHPLGGRLVAYFFLDANGVHQLLAPSNQFTTGFGDPSTWHFDYLDGYDPAGIHGAFADSDPPWPPYSVQPVPGAIVLASPELKIEKTFRLKDSSLVVDYSAPGGINSLIPVAINPWLRFSPGWSEAIGISPLEDGYRIGHQDSTFLDISADSALEIRSFIDTSSLLARPEDPNYDYPAGHYLPFPLSVIAFEDQGNFSIRLQPSSQAK